MMLRIYKEYPGLKEVGGMGISSALLMYFHVEILGSEPSVTTKQQSTGGSPQENGDLPLSHSDNC